ncbi:amino acid adenylation domain-containing protein [Nonomuraea sp. NPDC046802]|uniref:non-ribosomal peptide synthetase n=1 Tax=Nonomuraea sp. NPDC046802 TaxID=3154919 RepID=UPI0033C4A951
MNSPTSSESVPGVATVPLSVAQQQIWLLGQLLPNSPLLNVAVAARLPGELDEGEIEAALRTVTARHAALAERFIVRAGQPARFESSQPVLEVVQHDLSLHRDAARGPRASELIARTVVEPFDPTRGPLARACVIRSSPQELRLVLVLHGLVADQRSAHLLVQEILNLCHASHKPSPAPSAPRSPAPDRQRPQVTQEPAGRSRARSSFPALVELPLDRPRPHLRGHDAESVPFELSPTQVAAVRQLCAAVDVGVQAGMLALYLVLLYRYSGQHVLTVTVQTEGRPAAGTESAVGRFERSVPGGFEVIDDSTVPLLAAAVQRELTGLKDAGRPRVTPSVLDALLSQPIFSFHSAVPPVPFAGCAHEEVPVPCGAVWGDLALRVWDDGVTLYGRLDHATDVFDGDTARRAVSHLLRLLDGVVEEPSRTIASLPLLTPVEERTIAVLNGEGSADRRPGKTVTELFENWAAARADSCAVHAEDLILTYGELNRRANQLAHLLVELGVGPETPVALAMERNARLAVAVLGVLKAGGTYVPLEVRDPVERRQAILDNAGVGILLTTGPADASVGRQVVVLDTAWSALEGRPADNLHARRPSLHQAAYLLYTSGSTGEPKGVMVEHRQLASYIDAIVQRFGIDEPLSFAMVQPLAVDSSVTAFHTPLCTGGEVHMIPRAHALDAGLLADWMHRRGVDCLKIAPSHLRAFEASPRFADLLPRRLLIVGGEASDWQWLRGIQRLVPHCRVFNHYGPTETTVGVLTLAVDEHMDADWGTTPVGIPLPGTQAYVVDGGGRQVPTGVVGELLIGGQTVARGYHGRDDLTSASFLPDTFGGRTGNRLYRTGDFVRRLADGTIVFLGRRDDQVKVRGFRVELGEIDAAVKSHPHVRNATTIVREDLPGERRIVCYVEPHALDGFLAGDLERHLRAKLPAHMVPQVVMPMERLPLSAHGKVDRGALPAPAARPAAPVDAVSPRTEVERRVAAVWRELFRLDAVDVEQNFFDLGGHSLLLVELQHRLRSAVDGEIALLDLFQHTTVRAQAEFLAQNGPRPPTGAEDAKSSHTPHKALLKRRQQQLRAERGLHE